MTPIVAKLLPAGLAFIMFVLGLKLELEDFRRVLIRPIAVGLGLIAQVVLLPVTAFGVILVFGLAPETAVGLMILAACPGGVTAAMITDLSRGDTCLSITLTACTSLLAFVSVPVIVGLSMQHFLAAFPGLNYPVGQAVSSLFLVTLVPVAAGMLLNHADWLTEHASQLIGRAATTLFVLIVVTTFLSEWPSITEHFSTIGPAILLLNLLTMATGAALGAAARLPTEGRIALAVECGVQNSALGITVAVSLLSLAELAVPSVIYAFLMNVSAMALIVMRQLRSGRVADA